MGLCKPKSSGRDVGESLLGPRGTCFAFCIGWRGARSLEGNSKAFSCPAGRGRGSNPIAPWSIMELGRGWKGMLRSPYTSAPAFCSAHRGSLVWSFLSNARWQRAASGKPDLGVSLQFLSPSGQTASAEIAPDRFWTRSSDGSYLPAVLMPGVYGPCFHHSIIWMTGQAAPRRRSKLPNKSSARDTKWTVLLGCYKGAIGADR